MGFVTGGESGDFTQSARATRSLNKTRRNCSMEKGKSSTAILSEELVLLFLSHQAGVWGLRVLQSNLEGHGLGGREGGGMDGAGRAGLWGVLPKCVFAPHRHLQLQEGWGCLLVLQKWAVSLPRGMGPTLVCLWCGLMDAWVPFPVKSNPCHLPTF